MERERDKGMVHHPAPVVIFCEGFRDMIIWYLLENVAGIVHMSERESKKPVPSRWNA